jgi:hypothetical protein
MKDILQPLFNQFMPFAQKRMGFQKPPRVFLRDDPQNAQNPLGKTAYYDPEQMSVTLYINGRHPKDVMRSLSHELVHHTQNCNGQFDGTHEMGEGYAQNDEHLREMEREAYEQGNLCFRDWEDSIKGTIYNESLQKGAKKDMSTKDWKKSQDEEVVEEAAEEVEEGVFKGRTGDDEDLPNSVAAAKKKRRDDVYKDAVKGYYGEKDYRNRLEEEEELDEGASSSGRELTADREQNDDRRSSQKRARPMEEAEEKGKYDDGDGKDEKCDHVPCKDQDKKEKMDEAQIRQLIRKLVKEAMNRKETK